MALASLVTSAGAITVQDAGDAVVRAIPGAALAGAVVHEKEIGGAYQLILSMGASQIVTEGLKAAVEKTRPNGIGEDSFPSGHASAAFTGAGFVHRRYGWKIAIPAYAGAAFVAFSRLHADKHDVVDVVAGAVIGVASSFAFTQPYRKVVVTPTVLGETPGVALSLCW